MEKLTLTEKISNSIINLVTLVQGSVDKIADLLEPKTPRQKIERVLGRLEKGFIRGRKVGPKLEQILAEVNDLELENLQSLLNREVEVFLGKRQERTYTIKSKGRRVKVGKY